MKTCTKCKVEKPFTEFSNSARYKDGVRTACKSCDAAYRAVNREKIKAYKEEYRRANPDKCKAQNAAYHAANRERVKAQQAAYRAEKSELIKAKDARYRNANRERLAAYQSEYRAANLEIINTRKAERRQANPEKFRAWDAKYYNANPEKCAAKDRNRRARVRSAEGRHTAADVRTIFTAQRGLCANCKTQLFKSGKQVMHIDHIVPLARGGSNDKYNLQCLCPTCNMKKSAKDPITWAAEHGRLL